MTHVRKGCLTRLHQDIKTDGSRIEAFNRALNALMRTYTCGLELYLNLTHDFVLRRNIRIGMKIQSGERSQFTTSTYGSHHVGLVDRVARHWNRICEALDERGVGRGKRTAMIRLPVLLDIPSLETFGLGRSRNSESFGGLLTLELKDEDEEFIPGEEPDLHVGISQAQILRFMDIDPDLALLPEGAVSRPGTQKPSSAVASSMPAPSTNRNMSPSQPETRDVIVSTGNRDQGVMTYKNCRRISLLKPQNTLNLLRFRALLTLLITHPPDETQTAAPRKDPRSVRRSAKKGPQQEFQKSWVQVDAREQDSRLRQQRAMDASRKSCLMDQSRR